MKLKRILNAYEALENNRRVACFNASDSTRFYADAEYRQKINKMAQIVGRMFKFYWKNKIDNCDLKNALNNAVTYLGDYEINKILIEIKRG